MKIKVVSKGETEFDADTEYTEPAIREAIKDAAAAADPRHVALTIIDYTDTERSDIDHDEHATVTEDNGTVLWSGWLSGGMEDEPAPGGDEAATLRAIITEMATAIRAEMHGNSNIRHAEVTHWTKRAGVDFDIHADLDAEDSE